MKNNEEKMKELLLSQLKKEAKETIAQVEADESLKHLSAPEEMDETLWKMIREHDERQAAYENMSEKDKEALRLGRELMILREMDDDNENDNAGANVENETDTCVRKVVGGADVVDGNGEKVVRYRRKRRHWKVYVLVAVVAALVLGMGMTSIGGAPFLTGLMERIVGERGIVQVDTERENGDGVEVDTSSESEVYEKIKAELGVDVVRLGYMPEEAKLLTSDIDKKLARVCLLFQYQEEIIEHQIVVNYKGQVHGYDVEDKLIDERDIMVSGVNIQVREYLIDGNKKEYVARFEYKDAFYTLNAAISEEEFMKIINNLFFY